MITLEKKPSIWIRHSKEQRRIERRIELKTKWEDRVALMLPWAGMEMYKGNAGMVDLGNGATMRLNRSVEGAEE